MWANAERDSRPSECKRRPLFNAAVWLTPTIQCRAVCEDAKPVEIPWGAPN